MSATAEPRPFNLDDPAEWRRLLREVAGYVRTSSFAHEGTDRTGRIYAAAALERALKMGAVLALPQDLKILCAAEAARRTPGEAAP